MAQGPDNQDGPEVTPEMIEAGIAAISPIHADFFDTSSNDLLMRLVVAVFRAMSEVGRTQGVKLSV